ncbi:golgin subfamily A member 5-like [Gossypium australe]|uniref:Golgin subfamily A member 5-like n=1 Tax=Gossypium australe TaxID=47621 RepID=A0A5B6WSQ0_9ROSI|nr:golgin subfamily A member 5-like [Gossypium australe]
MIPDEILYRCGDFDWVPLLEIWGAIGYAPLLVLRQYRSRQFILATQWLAQCEFSCKGDNYKKKVREISNAWNQTCRFKRLATSPMTTPEYNRWWGKRVNDNIPVPRQEGTRPMEEYLQVIPSKLENIQKDFKKRNSELGKKIEQLEGEKMQLGLDRLKADKLIKGKNKAEEDLDSLKIDYKKLRLSMRTVGLGKISEQWRQEIEKSLHQYRSRNSIIELKASLNKIEELKGKMEKLETVLQNCEL